MVVQSNNRQRRHLQRDHDDRHTGSNEEREKAYRPERYSGSFYRRLPLPYAVDPERIDATLSDGVLEIRIPKPPGQHETARRIPVRHVRHVCPGIG
jgi:HSP20 family protein